MQQTQAPPQFLPLGVSNITYWVSGLPGGELVCSFLIIIDIGFETIAVTTGHVFQKNTASSFDSMVIDTIIDGSALYGIVNSSISFSNLSYTLK